MELLLLLLLGMFGVFDSSSSNDDSGSGDGDPSDPPNDQDQNIRAGADPLDFKDLTATGDIKVIGGPGDDVVGTGSGDDLIFGGDGADSVYTGDGNDRAFLGDGDDRLFGTVSVNGEVEFAEGEIFARGGNGDDDLRSFAGTATFHGDLNADTLITLDRSVDGEDHQDLLYGGFGSDFLIGDDGDTMYGGAGADDFAILTTAAANEEVVIEDFDASEGDAIIVDMRAQVQAGDLAVNSETAIVQTVDAESNSLVLAVEGQEVARLNNTSAEIPADSIRLLL